MGTSATISSEPPATMASEDDLDSWLRLFKLERYAGAIQEASYDELIFMREADENVDCPPK
jgi:hypothetical protein